MLLTKEAAVDGMRETLGKNNWPKKGDQDAWPGRKAQKARRMPYR
jgi:hypothetical protein